MDKEFRKNLDDFIDSIYRIMNGIDFRKVEEKAPDSVRNEMMRNLDNPIYRRLLIDALWDYDEYRKEQMTCSIIEMRNHNEEKTKRKAERKKKHKQKVLQARAKKKQDYDAMQHLIKENKQLKQQIIDILCKISYIEYLKTDHWKTVRKTILERDNHKCHDCGGKATQVHHLSYKFRGHELDNPSCCISLCKNCHQNRHKDKCNTMNT